MLSDLTYRLRALFHRNAVEREMDAELRFHFERQVEKYRNSGLPRDEAIHRARTDFGAVDVVKEECRDARGLVFVETDLQDIRYALRMMRRYPGFAVMAILLVALGIGATTSIFSLVAASVLRRSQFSDRLVYIWRLDKREARLHTFLPADIAHIGPRASSLNRLAIYEPDWPIISSPRGRSALMGTRLDRIGFRHWKQRRHSGATSPPKNTGLVQMF